MMRSKVDLLIKRTYYMANTNNLNRLKERGLILNYFPDDKSPELLKYFANPPQKFATNNTTLHPSVYCGFDATSDSLHIGNLLSIILLIHAQRAGFQPIALIGGATAEIGDPSGKLKDRPLLDRSSIDGNVDGIKEDILNVFNNHQTYIYNDTTTSKEHQNKRPLLPVKILDNREWYKDRNVVDFLVKVGRHFRMGNMLSRTSVQSRLTSCEGLCLTEFLYQMFQAYDWYYLHNNYNCSLQIGGCDQMGNIVSGFEFINKVTKQSVYGLTTPLITTSSGQKLGKSEGNSVYLASNKTSPFELYQHFIRTPDDRLSQYLRLFTFLSEQQCFDAIVEFKRKPVKQSAHKLLAEEVVKLTHAVSGVDSAIKCSEALYSGNIDKLAALDRITFQTTFKGASTTSTPFRPSTTLLDALMSASCFNNTKDAERITKAGGVHVNHQKETNPHLILSPATHILPNNFTLIRIGKKNYHIIDWLRTGFYDIQKDKKTDSLKDH